MVFLSNHLACISKPNVAATKSRHQNLNDSFKKLPHAKLNPMKLKPGLGKFYTPCQGKDLVAPESHHG